MSESEPEIPLLSFGKWLVVFIVVAIGVYYVAGFSGLDTSSQILLFLGVVFIIYLCFRKKLGGNSDVG